MTYQNNSITLNNLSLMYNHPHYVQTQPEAEASAL